MKNNSGYEFPWDHLGSEEDKAVKSFFICLFCFVDNGVKRNTDVFLSVSFSASALACHCIFKDLNAHATPTRVTFNSMYLLKN